MSSRSSTTASTPPSKDLTRYSGPSRPAIWAFTSQGPGLFPVRATCCPTLKRWVAYWVMAMILCRRAGSSALSQTASSQILSQSSLDVQFFLRRACALSYKELQCSFNEHAEGAGPGREFLRGFFLRPVSIAEPQRLGRDGVVRLTLHPCLVARAARTVGERVTRIPVRADWRRLRPGSRRCLR